MEGVQFEDNNIDTYMKKHITRKPSIATFLVSKGIASNEAQANVMLLVVAVIFLGLSAFLFTSSTKQANTEPQFQIPDELLNRLPQNMKDSIKKSDNK